MIDREIYVRDELRCDGFNENEIDEILIACSFNDKICIDEKKKEINSRKIQKNAPKKHRCR
ncbi:MAG: hypothetical protein J0647_05595 [Campylobacteraceae bacterium]|nr:hypothetical protein [Campylobacteraceae bacterium]